MTLEEILELDAKRSQGVWKSASARYLQADGKNIADIAYKNGINDKAFIAAAPAMVKLLKQQAARIEELTNDAMQLEMMAVGYEKALEETRRMSARIKSLEAALQEVLERTGSYCGCRCDTDDVDAGDCWPCRMVRVGIIAEEALREVSDGN